MKKIPQNIRAALFDMDGVLLDSMPIHARCWREAMKKFGIDMPEIETYRIEGMRGIEICKMKALEQLHREISDAEAEEMYAAKSEGVDASGQPPTMEGVKELMEKMKADGLTIVVVTGSGHRSLLDDLERRFPRLIDAELMVTSYDVSRGKPHPEPYIKGMEKANVTPQETIVIENAPLGVRSAKAAGAFTIAVNTGPLPAEALKAEGADMVFASMKELRDEWDNIKEK